MNSNNFKSSRERNLDHEVSSFFRPMDSSLLSTRNYKNVQSWVIGIIVFLALILVILFFILIVPHKNYENIASDTQVIVRGTNVNLNSAGEQPSMPETNKNNNEDLEVETIMVENNSTKELAVKSPLLKSKKTGLVEYQVKSGDTLEKIAKQFYGQYSQESLNKIKSTNNITRVNCLQIGQKLMIPM
jgi:LysM repeat protein